MSLHLRPYTPADATQWDNFCADALQATFLHSRQFLSYHGNKFHDLSLIIENEGKTIGLLPAAQHPQDVTCVVSHPGITYGGIVHQGGLRGELMIAALEQIIRHYAASGYATLLYKAVPAIYHRAPAQDDLYALFRLGASRIRCDLSSTIDLEHRMPISDRRKRSLKKAVQAGVEVVEGTQLLPQLWQVVTENLLHKHNVKPVHTLTEITLLAQQFPDNIRCVCATINETTVAGVLLFITPTCIHAQYIASTEEGQKLSALDAVFHHCIELAYKDKKRWFDFGISTEKSGTVLNDGLYRFKSEFGGGGMVHEFYELNLGE